MAVTAELRSTAPSAIRVFKATTAPSSVRDGYRPQGTARTDAQALRSGASSEARKGGGVLTAGGKQANWGRENDDVTSLDTSTSRLSSLFSPSLSCETGKTLIRASPQKSLFHPSPCATVAIKASASWPVNIDQEGSMDGAAGCGPGLE